LSNSSVRRAARSVGAAACAITAVVSVPALGLADTSNANTNEVGNAAGGNPGTGSGGAALSSSASKFVESVRAATAREASEPQKNATGGAGLGAPGPSVSSTTTSGATSICCGGRSLHVGDTGRNVVALQTDLTMVGYFTTADGDFGPATRQSVIKFQRAHGLPGTGVAGTRVEGKLAQLVKALDKGVPGGKVRINMATGDGIAPSGAPQVVKTMVAAANRIIDTPYIYGGGHGTWNDSGYDCSGAVSYVLHAAGMLSSSEDSGELESFGAAGPGKWVTIYANPNHTWIVIGGRAFDTSDFGGPNIPDPPSTGPRWRTDPTGNFGDGEQYVVRHPAGL
jgi:peptidoglycan hydrolase-like protein with peptidoglycan-binding domain